jgi:hypothetical protein
MMSVEVPDGIAAPVQTICDSFSGLTAQVDTLNSSLSTVNALLAASAAEVIELKAELAALQPKPLLLGAAATSEASYDGLGVTLLRQYNRPNVIPAIFKSTYSAAKDMGGLHQARDGSQPGFRSHLLG